MQKIYLFILLCFFIKPCLLFADEEHKYSIIGTLPDSIDNVCVYLTSSDWSGNFTSKDSTLIQKGKFLFGGIADKQKRIFTIWTIEYPTVNGVVVIEPGTILYNYQDDSVKGFAYAKGTYLNDYLTDSITTPTMLMAKIGELLMSGKIDAGNPKTAELKNELHSQAQKLPKNILSFIHTNIDNPIGGYVFLNYNSLLRPPFLSENERNNLLANLSEDVRQKYEEMNLTPQASVGKQFIPFRGKMLDNKYLSVADVVKTKKLTLLDFWASWCVTCLKEVPTLLQLYNDYQDKGLEIVGISIDDNEQLWRNSVQRHNMLWAQVISKKGESDDIGKLYGISTIPYLVLINDKGEVIATNLRGQELINKVKSILK